MPSPPIDRAIILASAKSTRFKPYTISLPKPQVLIGETPILEIIVRQFDDYEHAIQEWPQLASRYTSNAAE